MLAVFKEVDVVQRVKHLRVDKAKIEQRYSIVCEDAKVNRRRVGSRVDLGCLTSRPTLAGRDWNLELSLNLGSHHHKV
jgi:hypothetical protein